MNTDLDYSLFVANRALDLKRKELNTIRAVLGEAGGLSDEIVVLLADICNVEQEFIRGLRVAIDSLKEQKRIFGNVGLPKDLDFIPIEDYPDNQQPQKETDT